MVSKTWKFPFYREQNKWQSHAHGTVKSSRGKKAPYVGKLGNKKLFAIFALVVLKKRFIIKMSYPPSGKITIKNDV